MPESESVLPSIGRIVHFVQEDLKHRPALIVEVWNPTCVNLQVFLDGTNDAQLGTASLGLARWETSVAFSEDPRPLTWHWPEKVSA